jgi:guanylate kinase
MLSDPTKDRNSDAPLTGRGMLVVVSSPSGGGKGTLIDRVLKTVPEVSYSVSYTTRAPRGTEQNGREYFFVDRPAFEAMIERSEFLEWADVYGHLYGTNAGQVERERAAGHDIILEIDVQGAASIRGKVPDSISVFILPPSFELLRQRLVARNTDSVADLERRMKGAPSEVEQYKFFDYVVLNDDINRASQQLAAVIYAERARRERQEVMLRKSLEDFGVVSEPPAAASGQASEPPAVASGSGTPPRQNGRPGD